MAHIETAFDGCVHLQKGSPQRVLLNAATLASYSLLPKDGPLILSPSPFEGLERGRGHLAPATSAGGDTGRGQRPRAAPGPPDPGASARKQQAETPQKCGLFPIYNPMSAQALVTEPAFKAGVVVSRVFSAGPVGQTGPAQVF